MAGKGTVTERDIISKEALGWGPKYKKNVQEAIDINGRFVSSAKEMAGISNSFGDVATIKEYTDAQGKQLKASQQVQDLLAKESKVRQNLQNERKKQIEIEAKEIDLKNKKNKVTAQSNKLSIQEKVQLQVNNKLQRQQARNQLGLVGAYEKLNRKRTEAQKTLANLLATEKKDISSQKKHTAAIAKATAQYQKLNRRVLAVDKATDNFTKNIGNYKSALSGLAGTYRSLTSALGLAGGTFAFIRILGNGIKTIREFGVTMSTLAGIFRVSRKDLGDLEEKIISVAGNSVNTATEVAKLAESLATLGKSKEEIELLLEPVNNLAIGLKATAEETAEFLVQTINAFDGSASEAEKYADTIATIRTSTSLDFQKMRDSFQYLTPISRVLNKDLAYTGALIGILADNSVKAERAGRLLGTAQQKLAKEGKTLVDALDIINDASARGIKEHDLLAIASNLFGKQAATLGVILAANSDLIEENAEAIRNNGGALKDLVDEQLTSLDGYLRILKSRWEEYILNQDKASGSSNKLKKVIKFLSDNIGPLINSIIIAVKWFVIYKGGMIAIALYTSIATKKNVLYRISMIAMRGGIRKTIIAMKALKIATGATGIGLFLIALGSAYELFQAFSGGAKDATDEMSKLNAEMEAFKNAGNEYAKTILTYKKGNEQIGAVMEVQAGILKRVFKNLKASRDEEYQSNEEHVRGAKKLIQETTETDVQAIRKKIQARATYSKKQEDYLVREIARYQALEKIYLENEAFLEKQELDRLKKKEGLDKKELARLRKLRQAAYELAKFRKEEEIKALQEVVESEKESYVDRLKAVSDKEQKQIELAELTEKYLLSNKKLTTDEIILIEERTSAKLIEIYKKTNDKIKTLTQELIDNAPELFDYDTDAADEDIRLLELGIKNFAKTIGIDGEGAVKQFEETYGNSFAHIAEFYEKLDKVAKESAELRRQLEEDLALSSIEFVNTLFDAKLSKIEDEIYANNDKYDVLIEQAGEDERKKDILEKERDKKNKELEKKRRAEERKAAIFNKIMAVTEIGINLAKTISAINLAAASIDAVTFGIGGSAYRALNIPLAIGSSALQIGSVLARPIPKYKHGRGPGKAEVAEVGDGYVHEVVEKGDGTAYLTPNRPTLTYLEEDDTVHKNLGTFLGSKDPEGYQSDIFRATIMANLDAQSKKVDDFQQAIIINNRIDEALIVRAINQSNKKNSDDIKNAINKSLLGAKTINKITIESDEPYKRG